MTAGCPLADRAGASWRGARSSAFVRFCVVPRVFSRASPVPWNRNVTSTVHAASPPALRPQRLPGTEGETRRLSADCVQAGRGGRVDAAPSGRLPFHLRAGCGVLVFPPVRPAPTPLGLLWGAAGARSTAPGGTLLRRPQASPEPAGSPGEGLRPAALGAGRSEPGLELSSARASLVPPSCPFGFSSLTYEYGCVSSCLPRSAVCVQL